jgi:hypothetical protein
VLVKHGAHMARTRAGDAVAKAPAGAGDRLAGGEQRLGGRLAEPRAKSAAASGSGRPVFIRPMCSGGTSARVGTVRGPSRGLMRKP